MSLIEAKVSVELREVVLKEKPQEMVEASAKGTVPVLLPSGDQGEVIDESLEIMLWALTHNNTQWLSGPVTLSKQLEIIADLKNLLSHCWIVINIMMIKVSMVGHNIS